LLLGNIYFISIRSIPSFLKKNRICKWFRNIAYDDEFWTTIDLTSNSKSYSNRVLLKFVHRFPRDCTEVFKITGASIHTTSGKLPSFAEQVNSAIRISYPNLRYLHITQYDFHNSVDHITSLPANLQGLYLKKCEMLTRNLIGKPTFFQLPNNSPAKSSLQQLEILSFENSSCLISESINSLPNLCSKLIELNLNGCFRLNPTNTFINTLLSYSNTLRRLYLSQTQITDDTIHSICRKLKRLNLLDIRQCKHVTINIVENLLTLKQLQKLIANDDIQTLYYQRLESIVQLDE
jgi:hypothetical protein